MINALLYHPLLPVLILLGTGLVLLCLRGNFKSVLMTAFGSGVVALIFGWLHRTYPPQQFLQGVLYWNSTVAYAHTFIIAAFLLSLVSCIPLARSRHEHALEYVVLLLLSTIGAVLVCMSRHLIALFLAIELMSIPLYALCAFRADDSRSREAGFKYFILGSFAVGFLLMGMAYVYGATGSFFYDEIALGDRSGVMMILGSVLLLAGLGFKAALFPFHHWLPDVYEGAPAPVTAFMISAVKMAAFTLLLALLVEAKIFQWEVWQQPLKILVMISMSVANLAALKQKSLKRMLAYSSIAHVAYTFMALLATSSTDLLFAQQTVHFYIAVYGFASLGIFAIIAYLDPDEKTPFYYEKLNGLSRRAPYVTLVLSLLLASLAGMPPLAGFIGKFYLFTAAIQSQNLDLAIVAIINSLIAVYYYARPIVIMTMGESAAETDRLRLPKLGYSLITVTLFLTLLFGIMPSLLMSFVGNL